MDRLKAIVACFPCQENTKMRNEKPGFRGKLAKPDQPHSSLEIQRRAAQTITDILLGAEKARKNLRVAVADVAAEAGGWKERIAVFILNALKVLLEQAGPLGGAMRKAYDKAVTVQVEVIGFVKDHPVLCTVIALGILMILGPAIIHALGFGLAGPLEGSWAAAWQATYGGFVEAGSLFSYLQKLGMLAPY